MQRHVIKSYAVWDIPDAPAKWGAVVKAILSDWQLSGVLTAGSAYQPGAIQSNGAAQTNPTNCERPLRHQLHVSERRHEHEPDRLAGLRGQDRLPRRSGVGLLEQPVPAVQHGGGHRADLRQRRPGVGPLPPRRLPGPHRRHGDRQEHPARRQRTLQFRFDVFNVFNTVIYNDRNNTYLPEPDRQDHRQLAVPAGRLARSEPPDAAKRGLRRRHQGAAAAEHAAADSVRVLRSYRLSAISPFRADS